MWGQNLHGTLHNVLINCRLSHDRIVSYGGKVCKGQIPSPSLLDYTLRNAPPGGYKPALPLIRLGNLEETRAANGQHL